MTPQNPAGTRARVIKCVDEYWRKYYVAPSMRDLEYCAKLSKSHVYKILVTLEKDGVIAPREGGVARDIVPMWVIDAIDKAKVEQ